MDIEYRKTYTGFTCIECSQCLMSCMSIASLTHLSWCDQNKNKLVLVFGYRLVQSLIIQTVQGSINKETETPSFRFPFDYWELKHSCPQAIRDAVEQGCTGQVPRSGLRPFLVDEYQKTIADNARSGQLQNKAIDPVLADLLRDFEPVRKPVSSETLKRMFRIRSA